MPVPNSQDDHAAPPEQKGVRVFLSRGNLVICGVVVLVLLSLHIAFRFGYKVGYGAAMGPEGKNITTVFQIVSADDETLLDLARRRTEHFAWIKDDTVRREVLSLLLCTLAERQQVGQVEDLLAELMPPDKSQASHQRLCQVAWGLACAGKWSKAKEYFAAAIEASADCGLSVEEVLRAEMQAASRAGISRRELIQELEAMLPLAKDYPALCVELHVYIAKLYSEQGMAEKAAEYYRAAVELQGSEPDKQAVPADLAVCYGIALYETGKRDAAVEWLRRGLTGDAESSEAVADFRALALRHLATICQEEERPIEALAYLYRAEGEAAGRIPAESLFWRFVREQRAWAHYSLRMYEEALSEFEQVLAAFADQEDALRAQPLEGVARCCLALGRSEAALQAASECVALREKALAHDQESLGRAYLVLGQARDQAGQTAEAAEAYEKAAAALPEGSENRTEALRGRAHALTQTRRWEPAAAAWEELLTLLPRHDYARREEATDRLNACRRNLADNNKPQPAATRPASPAPARASSATHRKPSRSSHRSR